MKMLININVQYISITLLITFSPRIGASNILNKDADNIQIIHPRIYEQPHRNRRDIYFEECTKLKIIELGDWTVELNSEGNLLLAPGLKSEWIGVNGTTTKPTSSLQCDYKIGTVRGWETTSTAAVTLCGNLATGYIYFNGTAFFLFPLEDNNDAHVLYKSKKLSRKQKRSPLSKKSFTSEFSMSHQWMFNLTGDIIDIGIDDDVNGKNEIESAQRSDENTSSLNEGELDINVAEGNSSTVELLLPRREWHREQLDDDYDDDHAGYFYDTAWTANTIYTRKLGDSNLSSRWLEIAVAVDNTVISFHGRNKVENYILALMNIVSAIYRDPSLGANMKLVITRLLLYENHTVVKPGNAKRSLENVNSWNRRLHMSLAPGEPHHDLAVWLTRSDIGGPSGYAPVAGACDPKRSCALNRDEGLTSAFIIAHETAHILGLSHDGDKKTGNDCGDKASDGSVMAPMVAATFNKFFWSECSKNEFKRIVSKWTCLSNEPTGVSGEILLNATLQTSFSMDEQCRMEFGDGFSMCRVFDIIEPCSHLWCGHENSSLVCKSKKGPPLEGTECGFSKWCVNGYCEEIGQRRFIRMPVVLNPQDGNWSRWSKWGTCSRTCGIGIEFRSRKCNNPPPSYGGKNCDGDQEEWRTCNKFSCPEPLRDIRAEQCKRLPNLLNLTTEREGNLTWLPFETMEDKTKCKFICISEETKELYVTNENLIDGSPCSYDDSSRLCVQGKCHDIGCDGMLHSKRKLDRCGVCGGNNTECTEMRSSIRKKLKREVSRVAVLPRMAREINLDINVTMYKTDDPAIALILKNRRRKKYIMTIPNTIIHSGIIEGTKFLYKKRKNNHFIWAKGPVLAEMIILIYASTTEIETGVNISVTNKYSIHKNFLIPSKKFTWIKGGWGPCSASCGGGKRQKTLGCWDNQNNKMVRRKFCSLLQKPQSEIEKCNTFGCNFQWVAGEWEPCSTTCGTKGIQNRELYCVPNAILTKILYENNGTILEEIWKYMVSPNKCSGMSPTNVRYCNRIPCFSYWQFEEWSQCSASCGTGISKRLVSCLPPQNESFFTCGEAPPYQKKNCVGPYNRHNNKLCKGRKKKVCKGDESAYCSLTSLAKYCKVGGFRRLCCKTCSTFYLTPISV